jgi:polysaccharide biosynthesis/export protein
MDRCLRSWRGAFLYDGTIRDPGIGTKGASWAAMAYRAAHILALILPLSLAACGEFGRSGPYAGVVARSEGAPLAGTAPIAVVDLTGAAARQAIDLGRAADFAETFGEADPVGTVIGRGDTIDIAIWEAPPAALFGTVSMQNSAGSGIQAARSAGLPEQMVDETGRVMVPFVGEVIAAGRSPRAIEREIAERLRGKANHPQVVVRVTHNALQAVSVLGDVTSAGRFPITPHGERVLDALAYAGGAKQPVTRTVVQITRGTRVATMPLDTVIRQPAQNIRLAPDDVVTALFQPWSFTVLGATGNNAEVPFEATGLSLAQALGRAGGLADNRADMRGVFLFRLENPAALPALPSARPLPDGRIPVIYRLDLSDPAAFFTAQGFPMRDRDVLYVSNAPGADLQKFAMTVANLAYAGLGIVNQAK